MSDWTPLDEDVYLKGTLTVIVRGADGRPRAGQQISIRGCGFV